MKDPHNTIRISTLAPRAVGIWGGLLILLACSCEPVANDAGVSVLPSKKLNLGMIASQSESREGSFRLKNGTDRTVTILSARSSCGCINLRLDRHIINPNKIATLNVKVSGPYTPGMNRYFIMLSTDSPQIPLIRLEVGWVYARDWEMPSRRIVEEDLRSGETRRRVVEILSGENGFRGPIEAYSLDKEVVSVTGVNIRDWEHGQQALINLEIRAGRKVRSEGKVKVQVAKSDGTLETGEIDVQVTRYVPWTIEPASVCLDSDVKEKNSCIITIVPKREMEIIQIDGIVSPRFLEAEVLEPAVRAPGAGARVKVCVKPGDKPPYLHPGVYVDVLEIVISEQDLRVWVPVLAEIPAKERSLAN